MSSSSLISLLLCLIYCLASVVFLISTILFLKVLWGYFSDNLGCFDDLWLHVYFCDSNFNFLKQWTNSYFILYLSNNSNFWVICYLSLFLVFLSSGPHWHTLTCFNFCYKGKCGVEWSGEGKYVWVTNKNGCWKIKQNAPSIYQPPKSTLILNHGDLILCAWWSSIVEPHLHALHWQEIHSLGKALCLFSF